MAWFDLPRDELERYRSASIEPAGFDAFWRTTLDPFGLWQFLAQPANLLLPQLVDCLPIVASDMKTVNHERRLR